MILNLKTILGAFCGVLFVAPALTGATNPTAPKPIVYASDGSYMVPKEYREWIFLGSGLDMVYGPKAAVSHHMFDNVFVNPEAYQSFLKTGTWPDETVMVLEIRGAETEASINRGGQTQGSEAMGMEVHLKDPSRFPGGWAFFDVDDAGRGSLIKRPATCYSCHEEHGAVDTTFVQFYPVLLSLARDKGTLDPKYLKEIAAPAATQGAAAPK